MFVNGCRTLILFQNRAELAGRPATWTPALFAIYTFGPVILRSFGMADGNINNVGYALIGVLFLPGCLLALRLSKTT